MNNVIFVTNFLGNGGAARVMSILADYLKNENIEVEIISYLDMPDKYKINNDIKFYTIKCKRKNKILKKIERIIKLRRYFKRNKKSTIIAFEYFVNMETIIANMFLKNKIIVSERNDPKRMGNGKINKKIRNILYKKADYLVCQTQEAKEYFPKDVQKNTVIIPNPIMSNLPTRFEGKRKKEIMTFCRIEPQKNLIMLVDAFKMLNKEYKDYKLAIYGNRNI